MDDNIENITDQLPYALEFYMNVVPDEEIDDKTDDEEYEDEDIDQ